MREFKRLRSFITTFCFSVACFYACARDPGPVNALGAERTVLIGSGVEDVRDVDQRTDEEQREIRWYPPDDDVITGAETAGKLMVFYFYSDYCEPCEIMSDVVWNDPGVVRLVTRDFVPIKIDIDDEDDELIAAAAGIRVVPTVAIVDARGNTYSVVEGCISAKHMKRELISAHDRSDQETGAP